MTTTASTEWWKEFGLDARKSSCFFTDIGQIGAKAPQPHTLRRAFKQLDLDGVLCQDKAPLIYFRLVERMDSDEIDRLRKRFWNHGVAPILVLISRDEVQIYSSLDRDVGLVDTLNCVSDELQSFLLSVESGEFFHKHRKSFDPNQRVDRELLKNLQAAREDLDRITNPHITPQSLDALLCRLVFTCYLFDRGVIRRKYLEDIHIDEAEHLRDILAKKPRTKAKAELYALFKQLREDFNGDLFSDDLDAEARQIKADHLDILTRFFRATDVRSGQLSFLDYDFGVIPIETISAIYERFLKAADKEGKKKAGAFYTPRFLAEIVLDMMLAETPTLLDKRFLDPACGSGIFLVGLFHRLAEEWRLANPRARYDRQTTELMRLLTENLYGVDSNPTACRITAFSLYLAFLDQLLPPDIQKLFEKGKMLPRLVWSPDGTGALGGTIRHADFFTDEAALSKQVHFVVGNPPWAGVEDVTTPAFLWCSKQEKPFPRKQIAAAFIWKAAAHLEINGRVCFVLPHGLLFNHNANALDFQQEWFQGHTVDRILNLADYQYFLFKESKNPAIVVRYAKEKPSNSGRRIDYWAPKTDWGITKAEVMGVLPQDRSRLTIRAVLEDLRGDDAPLIWKEHYWATSRDCRLLDRLRLYPRLRDNTGQRSGREKKRWTIAEGFEPFGKNDSQESQYYLRFPRAARVEAKTHDLNLFLPRKECKILAPLKIKVRRNVSDMSIFKSPLVLVTEGFSKVAFAAFKDFDIAYRHGIRGIHGPSNDSNLLAFLAVYLRSALARYFLFHTSASWGVSRARVDVDDLLRLPLPFPNQTPDPTRAQTIVNKVAAIVAAAMKQATQAQIGWNEIVQQAQVEAEKLVEEYFDINDIERILIEDTNNVIIPSIRPTRHRVDRGSVKTILPSNENQRGEYIYLLCDTLNGWADKNQQVHGKPVANDSLGVGLVVLEKTRRGQTPGHLPESTSDVLKILQKLQRTAAKKCSSLELVRGLKVFDGNLLYITKPLGQRFWTRTAALNDADEIAGSILMQPGRGDA